jgi:SSS family solute:Na+ symporter
MNKADSLAEKQPPQSPFSLYRRSFGIGSIVFTLIATELGGSVMLGTAQEAYTAGLFGLLYIIGISIGLILLSVGFSKKMQEMNVSSTLDVFSVKYHSPSIRVCASILSTLTVGGLLIGQILAAKALIQSLGISNEYIFLLFLGLALAYTLLGGFSTATITYRAQLIYIILIFTGIFLYCVTKESPSFLTNHILDKALIFDSSSLDFSTIFASLVMPALYYITDQDFAKPFFDIPGKRRRIITALSASLFMIIFSLVPIYFGLKAKTMNLNLPDGTSPLIPVLTMLTNEAVVILAVCGIAAALIATIDSYLWCISYSITNDFRILFKNPDNPKITKIITAILGLIALGSSYAVNTGVVQTIISSYELYDSCLMVPLLMSYFKTDLRKGSAIGAICFGLFGFIFFRVVATPYSGEIASLVLSFAGYFIGGYIDNLLQKMKTIRNSRHCSV